MTTETKQLLAEEIKEATKALNLLIDKASEMKLIVSFRQQFHPASNMHTNPINAPLTGTISEVLDY